MAYFSSSPVAPPPSKHWNKLFDANLPSSPFAVGPAAASLPDDNGRFLDIIPAPNDGELSPSFDQSFQHGMNISSSTSSEDESDSQKASKQTQAQAQAILPTTASSSPHAMDISPAPPTKPADLLSTIPSTTRSTSLVSPLHRATPNATANTHFDQSFFSKLAANKPSPAGSFKSQPLAPKDLNVAQKAEHSSVFTLKKPPSLLIRTSSAAAAVTNSAKENDSNPFQMARPTALFMERAKSDNNLVFGAASQSAANKTRKPSGLSRETTNDDSTQRPPMIQYPSQTSMGRKIRGSSRIKTCLPSDRAEPANQAGSGPKPPRLQHALSAPVVKPPRWVSAEANWISESAVPTRRSLAAEHSSILAQQAPSSSPSGMDIDTSSPHFGSASKQRASLACSPGLGDLFEEGGVDLSSPVPTKGAGDSLVPFNRKRAMEDPDSSIEHAEGQSLVLSSPVKLTKGQTQSLSKATGSFSTRALHKQPSTQSLNSNSMRRRSSQQSSFAATGASCSSGLFSNQNLDPNDHASSSRHRKMSRGADGRPNLLKGRRTHSMCDSEFYASPPLETATRGPIKIKTTLHKDGGDEDAVEVLEQGTVSATDYFSTSKTAAGLRRNSAEVLSPPTEEMVLHSPPRPQIPASAKMGLGTYQPSPEASFTSGFGHKEAQGKVLPCFPVKEDGLMRITASTLNDLLTGIYDNAIDQYVVIDCRFDYEYKGGHIEGAINLPTSQAVEEFLLGCGDDALYANHEEIPPPSKSGEPDAHGNPRKTILVFHCEFSCKRAPTLAKHLRSRDRALNHAAYPAVHYPELYILQGGYAECYKSIPERCEPCGYVQMDDPRHLAARANELLEVRRKRLGTRAKSYTFGENLFSKSSYTKHLSVNVPTLNNCKVDKPGSSKPPMIRPPSLNAALFGKNASNSQLCVHEEEQDDGSSSSAEGDASFAGTKVAVNKLSADNDLNSSPCATESTSNSLQMMTGFSPCADRERPYEMPAFLTMRPQLMRPPSLNQTLAQASKPSRGQLFPPARTTSFGRSLQRTSTAATVTFGA